MDINITDHPLSFIPLKDGIDILKKRAEFHGFKESKDYWVTLGKDTYYKYVKNDEYVITILWFDEKVNGVLHIERFYKDEDNEKPKPLFEGITYSESDFDVVLKCLMP